MSFEIVNSPARVAERMQGVIEAALPGAEVAVRASGPGHFEVRVVSEAFRGQSRLDQQRLVLGALAPLMQGENAPVHAIDQIQTLLP
jgi:acid stress-induced BolA-like protein IbaG/YrbA